jgi:arylsulfatase
MSPPVPFSFRFLLAVLIIWFFVPGCDSGGNERQASSRRPNILLILVDDMGFSDLGCTGGEIPTPNIDRLAREGMLITDFYNAARCCPTRAALLTGLYPHRAGMGHQNQDRGHPAYRGRIGDRATTMGEVLGAAGYKTYQVGKWHVGDEQDYWPDRKGFDEHFTLIEGAMNYYNRRPWLRKMDSLTLAYGGQAYLPDDNFYATRTFTDTAVAFLERHDFGREPFFMYLAYNAPHWPLHAPASTAQKYRSSYGGGWDRARENRLQRQIELGLFPPETTLPDRWHGVPAWKDLHPTERNRWGGKMGLYAAVMEELDRGVGRVLNELDRSGQLDNTVVMLLSDNGASFEDPVPPDAPWSDHPTDGRPGGPRSFPSYGVPWANVSNTPFDYFKSYLHQGGIATPLLVRYPPAVAGGGRRDVGPGHVIDLMPTVREIAGARYPERIGGRSILPESGRSLWSAWMGEVRSPPRWLFWEHQFNRAVRHGDWKLVSAYRVLGKSGIANSWELYNLRTDPTEQNDLAGAYPARVDRMANRYRKWAGEVGVLSFEEMQGRQREN